MILLAPRSARLDDVSCLPSSPSGQCCALHCMYNTRQTNGAGVHVEHRQDDREHEVGRRDARGAKLRQVRQRHIRTGTRPTIRGERGLARVNVTLAAFALAIAAAARHDPLALRARLSRTRRWGGAWRRRQRRFRRERASPRRWAALPHLHRDSVSRRPQLPRSELGLARVPIGRRIVLARARPQRVGALAAPCATIRRRRRYWRRGCSTARSSCGTSPRPTRIRSSPKPPWASGNASRSPGLTPCPHLRRDCARRAAPIPDQSPHLRRPRCPPTQARTRARAHARAAWRERRREEPGPGCAGAARFSGGSASAPTDLARGRLARCRLVGEGRGRGPRHRDPSVMRRWIVARAPVRRLAAFALVRRSRSRRGNRCRRRSAGARWSLHHDWTVRPCAGARTRSRYHR